ncbi:hypothetical protein M427DRAFT_30148 [Gonapodya prolifera JEL478]|uniref:Uncharacterized protein n=1 Tax=Gonapodya prolifera (strain JEL478) TaxID=1344416 RepID=A0A139AMS5_GONPJ|nr:hypothetical protein M427DRAFT_30148 [Gonapodya prolifera JEL478]|eukprot:KXS18059.1 hypothetical protein M427DRAFT_30148 [Gonapodya prolifera JEL478]
MESERESLSAKVGLVFISQTKFTKLLASTGHAKYKDIAGWLIGQDDGSGGGLTLQDQKEQRDFKIKMLPALIK